MLCGVLVPGVVFAPGSPTLANPFSGQRQPGGVGIIVVDKDTHHPMFQQAFDGSAATVWRRVDGERGRNLFVRAAHVDGAIPAERERIYFAVHRVPRQQCAVHGDRSADGNFGPGDGGDVQRALVVFGLADELAAQADAARKTYVHVFNASYTFSKTLDYSDDDQVPSYTTVENVNLVEGTVGPQTEKGYGASDETHRLTVYSLIQMPWGFSLAPLYTHGSGIPADTFLPDLNLNGQSLPARLPILARNSLGREACTTAIN